MRPLVLTLTFLAASTGAALSQSDKSARPADANNWAETVPRAEAKSGQINEIVSTIARTTDRGVGDEIQAGREALGSSPTPSGRD